MTVLWAAAIQQTAAAIWAAVAATARAAPITWVAATSSGGFHTSPWLTAHGSNAPAHKTPQASELPAARGARARAPRTRPNNPATRAAARPLRIGGGAGPNSMPSWGNPERGHPSADDQERRRRADPSKNRRAAQQCGRLPPRRFRSRKPANAEEAASSRGVQVRTRRVERGPPCRKRSVIGSRRPRAGGQQQAADSTRPEVGSR